MLEVRVHLAAKTRMIATKLIRPHSLKYRIQFDARGEISVDGNMPGPRAHTLLDYPETNDE